MGLFRKNEKRKGSRNDLLSEEIFGYMQSEGFFPEMEEKDKGETDVSRIHFKFQGTNVTLETAEGNYVRIVMGFDLSHSNTDYFNLQCAASQIMYEMKAVKIVAAVNRISYTFVHLANVVAVELDLLLVGNDMNCRLVELSSAWMVRDTVIFLPFNITECHSLIFMDCSASTLFAYHQAHRRTVLVSSTFYWTTKLGYITRSIVFPNG